MPAKKKTTKRKASTKAPSPAQLRARAKFIAMVRAKSKASKKKAGRKKLVRRNSSDHFIVNYMVGTGLWRIGVRDASKPRGYAYSTEGYPTRDAAIKAGKKKTGLKLRGPAKIKKAPKRRNKTIITKPKKVVVINPSDLKSLYAKRAELLRQEEHCGVGRDGDAKREVIRRKLAALGDKIYKAEIEGRERARKAWQKNPKGKSTRRKYRNGYLDLVIYGHAKKTPSGWSLGGKTFKQGKGIVPASRKGYYLDKATGTVFSKKARNVAQGFFDGNGVFHPIRSSSDYSPGTAGETGRKPVRTRSKKRKASLKKAGQTARLKAETRRRKSTTSRLASRSLSRSAGILKGSGSRRQRKNPTKEQRLDSLRRSLRALQEARTNHTVWVNRARRIGDKNEAKALHANIKKIDREITQTKQQIAKVNKLKNPSVKTIRKEFAGTLGKASQVFAPIGTPRNVAKLGKLLLIDAEKATIKPTGIVYLCADSKGKLHLCGSKNVPIYSGAAQSFGKVKRLEYETAKPHLYPGQGVINFWHKMGEQSGNQPTLYADGKGGLKFRGGSYKLTREGIVD